jgi:7-cyano-7-deazaguanine synthase
MTLGNSTLVLFSGGQDSTVCLAWALARYERVETVGFRYGQRHGVEMTQREIVLREIARELPTGSRLGADAVLDLPALAAISDTALTSVSEITFATSGLPTTFVPGRNLLFLTYAAALAYRRGIGTLVGGMCETDFSGYPDCRRATLDALQTALSLGMDRPIAIETPLMSIDKAGTWAMAHELGGDALVSLIVEATHTCYLGDRAHRHDWGYGCGACPACALRAKGWERWRAGARSSALPRPDLAPGT